MIKSRVSVITVVLNDADGLEKTICSVISQKYVNLEFIIIDGGSTVDVLNVIKKYEKNITYWVSKKDKGIYDAMNKGIKVSTGRWLNFMNAGDTFVNENVLENIGFDSNLNEYALIYGNKIQNGKVIYPHDIIYLKFGVIMANHQSMFFNKDILGDELLYDPYLLIYADYGLVNKIYYRKYKIKYIDVNIANFEGGGISSKISIRKRIDKYKTLYKYYGIKGIFLGLKHRITE